MISYYATLIETQNWHSFIRALREMLLFVCFPIHFIVLRYESDTIAYSRRHFKYAQIGKVVFTFLAIVLAQTTSVEIYLYMLFETNLSQWLNFFQYSQWGNAVGTCFTRQKKGVFNETKPKNCQIKYLHLKDAHHYWVMLQSTALYKGVGGTSHIYNVCKVNHRTNEVKYVLKEKLHDT